MTKKLIYSLLISFLFYFSGKSCQCPFTVLGEKECAKYEIIFKGKIVDIKDCGETFGEATFEIEELYKGNATKHFKILFDCKEVCAMKFNVGEEWIIYSRYKQISNAKMDWCSRSRKYFKIDKQDFYTEAYGNNYNDEVVFLREKLGLHRTMVETKNAAEGRNQKPTTNQTIVILVCSLLTVIIFYWGFNIVYKRYNKRKS